MGFHLFFIGLDDSIYLNDPQCSDTLFWKGFWLCLKIYYRRIVFDENLMYILAYIYIYYSIHVWDQKYTIEGIGILPSFIINRFNFEGCSWMKHSQRCGHASRNRALKTTEMGIWQTSEKHNFVDLNNKKGDLNNGSHISTRRVWPKAAFGSVIPNEPPSGKTSPIPISFY